MMIQLAPATIEPQASPLRWLARLLRARVQTMATDPAASLPAAREGGRVRLGRKTPVSGAPYYAPPKESSDADAAEDGTTCAEDPRSALPLLDSDDDWEEDALDESEVNVSGSLLSALQCEVASEKATVSALSSCHPTWSAEKTPCPLCPFRMFASGASVLRHIQTCHTEQKGFVCSGRKQRKVVVALYDCDVLAGREPMDLLTRSAALLRSWIRPPLQHNKNAIDRSIRLVLTATGPVYANVEALGTSMFVRRVGNLFYTRCFGNILLRELVMSKGRLAEALTRLQTHACAAGSEVTNLYPGHGASMWAVAQDVFGLEPVCELFAGFYAQLLAREEFETLAMDGTVKVCLAIMGQAGAAAIREDACAAAMTEEEHFRRLVTVRGRSGAVLALRLVREESSVDVAKNFQECFTLEQREQVRFMSVDNPSHTMHQAFCKVFPFLECLALDVTHLAMNCEKGFGGRRSPGSSALRRVIGKFNAVDAALSPSSWPGLPFTGKGAAAYTAEEARWSKTLAGHGGMSLEDATAFLDGLDGGTPFKSRAEYIRALASVSVAYKSEMCNKGPKGANVRSILVNAATPTKCAWYFNNHYHRHSVDLARVPLLASGTTGNEALHNEIKQAFRQTIRLHQSTMATKTRVFLFGKLLSFTLARFRPTTRQMTPSHVLARAIASDVLVHASWVRLCEHRVGGHALRKAAGSLQRWRRVDVARMKRWLRKKPAASRRRTQTVKRTAFTLKRRERA